MIPPMLRGSCCCGEVRFALSAPPSMIGVCHCSRCRKAGSSAFALVKAADFRWLTGRELVVRLPPEPPYQYARSFCGRCGTSLGEAGSEADVFPINAETLDDDPGLAIRFHEFTAEIPAWRLRPDEGPRFEKHPVKKNAS